MCTTYPRISAIFSDGSRALCRCTLLFCSLFPQGSKASSMCPVRCALTPWATRVGQQQCLSRSKLFFCVFQQMSLCQFHGSRSMRSTTYPRYTWPNLANFWYVDLIYSLYCTHPSLQIRGVGESYIGALLYHRYLWRWYMDWTKYYLLHM